MAHGTLEKRLSALELRMQDQVTASDLQALQAALGAQILQLGAQMQIGFSALQEELREEIRAGDLGTRTFAAERLARNNDEIGSVIDARLARNNEETLRVIEERSAALMAADADIRVELAATDANIRALIEERTVDLLAVIAAEGAEGRRHARMLHEEVIARIETIDRG